MIIGKQGTTDSSLAWFAVGEYKKRANVVGGGEKLQDRRMFRNACERCLRIMKLFLRMFDIDVCYFEGVLFFGIFLALSRRNLSSVLIKN